MSAVDPDRTADYMGVGADFAVPTVRAVSYGGGKQSTALLVLAARGEIRFDTFLFANVGPKAENPETLAYFHEHALPYAAKHGLELTELRWVTRKGEVRDLYDDIMRFEKDIPIPVRLGSGAFANRKCTVRYKIEVVAREVKRRGATVENPAVVAVGFSTDEVERANPGVAKQQPWTFKVHPLLDLGLSRDDCVRIVLDEGLPEPPKSSCYFCPYQGKAQWRERQRTDPALFAKAEHVERVLIGRRGDMGRDRVGLLDPNQTLADALDDPQGVLFGQGDGCASDAGCWT